MLAFVLSNWIFLQVTRLHFASYVLNYFKYCARVRLPYVQLGDPGQSCAIQVLCSKADARPVRLAVYCRAKFPGKLSCHLCCKQQKSKYNKCLCCLEVSQLFSVLCEQTHTILTSYKMYCVFLMLGLNFFYTYFYMHLYQCSYHAVFHTYLTFCTNKFLPLHIDMAIGVIWFPRGISLAQFAQC